MKRLRNNLTSLFAVLSLIALAPIATSAQQAQTQTQAQRPKIYNPEADARADLAAAVARAAKTGKHVFVQVGGNWCGWCIKFHDLVDATPELKEYLHANYEPVLVNYSQENKNPDVMRSLGNPGRFGFPVFVILDGNGKVVHIQNSAYLEEGNGHSVKEVMNFLKGWTYAAVNPAD